MARWWDKSVECGGIVLFRGSIPPRIEDMPDFGKLGFAVARAEPKANMHWRLKLDSKSLGRAEVFAARQPPLPTRQQLEWAADLTPAEREQALLAGSAVAVMFKGRRDHLLRDRKTLLKLLGAVAGTDAVASLDYTAGRFWPPGALSDELAHDADVDVTALYTIHGVTGDGEDAPLLWAHSHGLAAIGLYDFDLIRPHRSYFGLQTDGIRALALSIAEGKLKRGGEALQIAGPGVFVRAVDAAEFDRLASPADREARESAREDHLTDRAVICEPAAAGLSRFWKRAVTPSKFFQDEPDERKAVYYSGDATTLAAERARLSYPMFRSLLAEMRTLLPAQGIVKLGYPVDGGGPGECEHMWFEVHDAGDDSIDATLAVQPFNIAAMKPGDRGRHPIDRMTEWLIPTPLGNITSSNTRPVRFLREHGDDLRRAMAERNGNDD